MFANAGNVFFLDNAVCLIFYCQTLFGRNVEIYPLRVSKNFKSHFFGRFTIQMQMQNKVAFIPLSFSQFSCISFTVSHQCRLFWQMCSQNILQCIFQFVHNKLLVNHVFLMFVCKVKMFNVLVIKNVKKENHFLSFHLPHSQVSLREAWRYIFMREGRAFYH